MRRYCPICNNDLNEGTYCSYCRDFVTPKTDDSSDYARSGDSYGDFNFNDAFSTFTSSGSSFDSFSSNADSGIDSYFKKDNSYEDIKVNTSTFDDSWYKNDDISQTYSNNDNTFENDSWQSDTESYNDDNVSNSNSNSNSNSYSLASGGAYSLKENYAGTQPIKGGTTSDGKYVSSIGNTFSNANNNTFESYSNTRYQRNSSSSRAVKGVIAVVVLIFAIRIIAVLFAIAGNFQQMRNSKNNTTINGVYVDGSDYGDNFFHFNTKEIGKYIKNDLLKSCKVGTYQSIETFGNNNISVLETDYSLYTEKNNHYVEIILYSQYECSGALAIYVSSTDKAEAIELSNKLLTKIGTLKNETVDDKAIFEYGVENEDQLSDGTYITSKIVNGKYVLIFN